MNIQAAVGPALGANLRQRSSTGNLGGQGSQPDQPLIVKTKPTQTMGMSVCLSVCVCVYPFVTCIILYVLAIMHMQVTVSVLNFWWP